MNTSIKLLGVIGLSLLSFSQFSLGAQYLELAVETGKIRVEYISTSDKGLIYPADCEQCTKTSYTFDGQPVIKRDGTVIPFDAFLSDYWNAKSSTLFLDPESLSVLRINY